ncbi:MAG: hypothetical protein P1V35_14310, partial [Planctomycetota bacterium]|nr:hypothetical protein [Planctomycetota bacterium]
MGVPTIHQIKAETNRLRGALGSRDANALLRCYSELAARNPLLEGRTSSTKPARRAFLDNIEAWDEVLQEWILVPGGDPDLLKELTVAEGGEFRFRHLLLMPVWLSAVGST